MLESLQDTIAAIASPPGGAARGIVRISGPNARTCVEQAFRPEPAIALSTIRVPTAVPGSVQLEGIATSRPCELCFWPGPRSFTGQPVAEFHTLGSPPLVEALLATLCRRGARIAQPGEFTLRAFLSGRIDLTQAESVLGVIDAADSRQLNVALAQLAGGLAGPLHQLRDALLDLLAHLEAGFDFADEDIEFIAGEELDRRLAAASSMIAALADQMVSRTETSLRMRAVLLGRPNTGKSSLFNALAGRSHAIVSEHAGTTRDYLTAEIDLGGVACLLVDTAGIEPDFGGAELGEPEFGECPSERIAREAQVATSEQSRQADVRLFCLDASRPINPQEEAALAEHAAARLVVLTKADVPRLLDVARLPPPVIETSSVTGQGLDAIKQELRARIASAASGDVVPATAARCRDSLRRAAEGLERACAIRRTGAGDELLAAEIRVALGELGGVVGEVYTEDVLERIFSRFCVGK